METQAQCSSTPTNSWFPKMQDDLNVKSRVVALAKHKLGLSLPHCLQQEANHGYYPTTSEKQKNIKEY